MQNSIFYYLIQFCIFGFYNKYALYIAESMGFEPTLRLFDANRISSAAPSTTRTTLHSSHCEMMMHAKCSYIITNPLHFSRHLSCYP